MILYALRSKCQYQNQFKHNASKIKYDQIYDYNSSKNYFNYIQEIHIKDEKILELE